MTSVAPRPSRRTGEKRVRYAVLGQGSISQAAILSAFALARRNSELAALVSDDEEKLRVLGRRYGVRSLHTYDQFDELLASGEVDAVYIALPNHLHLPFAVAAARAGIHVLCEKPLAATEEDCAEIVTEAERNRVKLMTAYRVHFERANLEAIQVAKSGRLGSLRSFSSLISMQVAEGNSRLQAEYGGGPLYDIGIDCINAARYLFRDEPVEVYATSVNSGDPRFREVEEMTAAVLRFPRERLATFTCSFGAAPESMYELVGTKGTLRLEHACTFEGRIRRRMTVGGRTSLRSYAARDAFAPELVYFSECIKKGRDPERSGWEGWADVRVVSALLRSASIGRPVFLEAFTKRRRPDLSQEISRRPVREPELVIAAAAAAER
jgi:glucose-fructose oxidoreductase